MGCCKEHKGDGEMSEWTYINAIITIDVSKKFWNEILNHLTNQEQLDSFVHFVAVQEMPKITGDECDALVFVNRGIHSNISQPYKGIDGRMYVNQYTTFYFLTIIGDLRGRMKSDTAREFKAVIAYLKEMFGKHSVTYVKRIFA